MGEKHKLHNVRLDDDVWAAIKAMDCSLNQYLRLALLPNGNKPPKANELYDAGFSSHVERALAEPPAILDNRPKNCFCKHCGSHFAGPRFSTICAECKGSGHTLTPAECPRCTEGTAI